MTIEKETQALEILAAGGWFVQRLEGERFCTRLIRSLEHPNVVVDGIGEATFNTLKMQGKLEYRLPLGFSRADYYALKGESK